MVGFREVPAKQPLSPLDLSPLCAAATISSTKDILQGFVGTVSPPPPSLQSLLSPRRRAPEDIKAIIRCQARARGWLARKAFKRRKKQYEERTKVAKEILQTERDYVGSLKRLVAVWLKPLNSRTPGQLQLNKQQEKEFKIAENLFQQDAALKSLFADIEVIVGYNSTILTQLEQRLASWSPMKTKLGDIFLRMASFLKAYTQYTQHYAKVQTKLAQLKNDVAFNNVLEFLRQASSERRTIKDYLIMPVQRIPRYNMLLQSLIKNTWRDHIDFDDLNNALQKILAVAEIVEESQKEYEQISKVVDISTLVSSNLAEQFDLVTPSRRFLREDDVLELSGGLPERRHLFMFNDLLLECSITNKAQLAMNQKTGTSAVVQSKEYSINFILYFEDLVSCAQNVRDGFPMGMLLTLNNGATRVYAFKNHELYVEWKLSIDMRLHEVLERQQLYSETSTAPATPTAPSPQTEKRKEKEKEKKKGLLSTWGRKRGEKMTE